MGLVTPVEPGAHVDGPRSASRSRPPYARTGARAPPCVAMLPDPNRRRTEANVLLPMDTGLNVPKNWLGG